MALAARPFREAMRLHEGGGEPRTAASRTLGERSTKHVVFFHLIKECSMKGLKTAFTVACAAAALLPGLAGHAANAVVFSAAGSSAMFNGFANAVCNLGAAHTYLVNASSPFFIDDSTTS